MGVSPGDDVTLFIDGFIVDTGTVVIPTLTSTVTGAVSGGSSLIELVLVSVTQQEIQNSISIQYQSLSFSTMSAGDVFTFHNLPDDSYFRFEVENYDVTGVDYVQPVQNLVYTEGVGNVTDVGNLDLTPIINTGSNRTASPGEVVLLNSENILDLDANQRTYNWTLLSRPFGSAAAIVDQSSENTSFVADLHGTYEVKIEVSDGNSLVFEIFNVIVNPVVRTYVNGIINQDTTWALTNSPYEVTDRIQVADGVTLTIEPGVQVYGGNNCTGSHCEIEVFGSMSALGTADAPVGFFYMDIFPGNTGNGDINIVYARTQFGALRTTNLQDSVIAGSYIEPVRCSISCRVERNVIIVSQVIVSDSSIFSNNIFLHDYRTGTGSRDYLIETNSSNVSIKNNSFVNSGRFAALISDDDIDLTNNYWFTLDASLIDSMIMDRSDDLNILGYGNFEPFLIEPDISTPDITPYL